MKKRVVSSEKQAVVSIASVAVDEDADLEYTLEDMQEWLARVIINAFGHGKLHPDRERCLLAYLDDLREYCKEQWLAEIVVRRNHLYYDTTGMIA